MAQTVPLPFWLALMVVLPVTAAGTGIWWLSRMDTNECQLAKTPLVSDSTRLYCAQLVADRQTANDWAEAIQLANAISSDHPLREDGDRLIQRWSNRLFEAAEATFQEGKLEDATKLLRQIPTNVPMYAQVPTRIQTWQTTWNKAETLFEQAQKALQDDKPAIALAESRKLLRVDNQYWNTTRFQELVNQIQATKESRKKQAAALRDRQKNSLSGGSLLSTDDLIARWEKEQAGEAATYLSKAKRLAAPGDMNSLRDAVAQAELIFSGTPQYPEAQRLITEWNQRIETIEDRPYLNRAIALASKGDLASLQAAISEANNIYFGRALYKEAQTRIDGWTALARQLHDQQYSREASSTPTSPFRQTDYRIPPAPTTP